MPTILNPSHLSVCIGLQMSMYAVSRDAWLGAAMGICFYLGREIAQAEYRKIEASASSLRKDMPLFGGLDPRFWTMKSFLADLVIPSAVVCIIALLAP